MNLEDLHLEDRLGMDEAKDCAVRALSIVSGETYRSVHEVFARAGRRPRKGAPAWMTWDVLYKMGLERNLVTHKFQAKTVVTLARELPSKGWFLIQVRNHILAAIDGKIIDWTADRRHRILAVYEVK